MKKIIVYRSLSFNSDVFTPTDYKKIDGRYSIQGGNVGNKLFNTAAEKYISNDYTEYDYVYYDGYYYIPVVGDVDFDEINEKYDLVIMPQANIFGDTILHRNILSMWAKGISNFKIPVYVLGVGIQAKNESEIKHLANAIGLEAKKFINAVYKTGGEFSLRGYYTKEFFRQLGFDNAVVTGCPSFYQHGRNLCITNDKIDKQNFKLALTGKKGLFHDKNFKRIINDINQSYYLDQDEFLFQLYKKDYFNDFQKSQNQKIKMLRTIPLYTLKMIHEDRLFLFCDLPTRFKFYAEKEITFSYGTRIHGNIMAMLNGVPGYVVTEDLRTKELAEFFHIPHSENISKDVYKTYLETDYSDFNNTFPTLYDNFENFLLAHNIIDKKLSIPNKFDEKISSVIWQEPEIINKKILDSYFSLFKEHLYAYEHIENGLMNITRVIGKMRSILNAK